MFEQGPQLLMLFQEVTEPLDGGALPKEVRCRGLLGIIA